MIKDQQAARFLQQLKLQWKDKPEPLALQCIQLTLIVVALSIFLHGTSVKPLMEHVWQRRKNAAKH